MKMKKAVVTRRKRSSLSQKRAWSDAPDLALDLISKKLGFIDHFMFADVCRQWRLVSAMNKREFLVSQPPLLLLPCRDSSGLCYFYSLPDRRLFTRKFPGLTCRGRSFLCFTAGYLVTTTDNRWITLVNPLTGAAIRCLPPSPYSFHLVHLHWPPTSPNWILLAFSAYVDRLQFFRPSHAEWSTQAIGCNIVDFALFQGKLYVLSSDGRLVILAFSRWAAMQEVEVPPVPFIEDHRLKCYRFLMESCGELLLVRLCCMVPEKVEHRLDVYRLVMSPGPIQWAKVGNLGNRALFISASQRSYMTLAQPRWGFQANCVYFTRPSDDNQWRVHSLDDQDWRFGNASDLFPSTVSNRKGDSPIWVFPHLC